MFLNSGNIPNDKRDADLYLKGAKQAILELFATWEVNGIDTSAFVLGSMHSAIEEINELLGVDDE